MEEYIINLPDEREEKSRLAPFLSSLDFLREREEFRISELQRYLSCGYGTAVRVIDALSVLCVIEAVEGPPNTIYKRRKIMKTFKVVYSLPGKPGKKVAFYQNVCADFARMQAYDDLGGFGVVTIWEVSEV